MDEMQEARMFKDKNQTVRINYIPLIEAVPVDTRMPSNGWDVVVFSNRQQYKLGWDNC